MGREEGGQLLCVRACMGFLGHCLLRPELATRVPGAFPRLCSLCVHGLVCAWVCASCACVHARAPVSWYSLLCGAECVCVLVWAFGHCLLRPELATRVPGAFPRRCSLCVHGLVCAWVCASCACVHARAPVSWYSLLCGAECVCVLVWAFGHCLLRAELATRVPGAFPRQGSLCVHGLVCAWVCASCACVHARVPVSWYSLLCGAECVCVFVWAFGHCLLRPELATRVPARFPGRVHCVCMGWCAPGCVHRAHVCMPACLYRGTSCYVVLSTCAWTVCVV